VYTTFTFIPVPEKEKAEAEGATQPQKTEEEEEEDEEEKLRKQISQLKDEERREAKRKLKKIRKTKQDYQKKLDSKIMLTREEAAWEQEDDAELFQIKVLRRQKDVEAVANLDMDQAEEHLKTSSYARDAEEGINVERKTGFSFDYGYQDEQVFFHVNKQKCRILGVYGCI
jgi:hypothetical protein